MTDSTQDPEQVYADLVRLYPTDAGFLRRYAEILLRTNKQETATEVLRRLYQALTEQGDLPAASELIRKYPQVGKMSESDVDSVAAPALLDMVGKGMFSARSQRQRVREGTYLFRLGENSKAYLVLDGELALMLPSKNGGKPILVDLIRQGNTVGIADCIANTNHLVNAIANQNTTVVELTRKQLLRFFLQHPKLDQEVQREEEERQRTWMISNHPMVCATPLAVRKHLAKNATIFVYKAGEMIAKAGKPIKALMLLVSGKVYTQITDRHGVDHILDYLEPYRLFGVLTTLKKEEAITDAWAQTDAAVMHLSLNSVTAAVQSHPPLKEIFLHISEHNMEEMMQAIERLGIRVKR